MSMMDSNNTDFANDTLQEVANSTETNSVSEKFAKDLCRTYILPPLTIFGIFFNAISIIVLLQNRIKLKRSLAHFFAYLNLSDMIFLACLFFIFSVPKLSDNFSYKVAVTLPYVVPVLQTSLTISVYMTVAIGQTALVFLQASETIHDEDSQEPNEDEDEANQPTIQSNNNQSGTYAARCYAMMTNVVKYCNFSHQLRRKYVVLVMVSVTIFAILFNMSRWFELSLEHVVTEELITFENGTKRTIMKEYHVVQHTELRKNKTYLQGYSLIFSTLVMILVPAVFLLNVSWQIYRKIPQGNMRRRTLKILGVIITMFLICHIPKAALTGLELFGPYGNLVAHWPVWAIVLNEFNNILLAIYSALNPLAYCGELIFKAASKWIKSLCCQCQTVNQGPRERNGIILSEYGVMKSVGITLNGPDPLPQQLDELDAQSRLLCGISKSS